MCGYQWVCKHGTLVMNVKETKWNQEGGYKMPEVEDEGSDEPYIQGWTRRESPQAG